MTRHGDGAAFQVLVPTRLTGAAWLRFCDPAGASILEGPVSEDGC
jgi:hypothetical protein